MARSMKARWGTLAEHRAWGGTGSCAGIVALTLLVGLAGGCEESGDSGLPAKVEIEGPLAPVFAAWNDAGLAMADFRPVDDEASAVGVDLGEGDCQTGQIEEIASVVCSYPSPQAAEAAQEAGLELVGAATGAALANGSLLLIVADRQDADPDGRRINDITKTFRELTD